MSETNPYADQRHRNGCGCSRQQCQIWRGEEFKPLGQLYLNPPTRGPVSTERTNWEMSRGDVPQG